MILRRTRLSGIVFIWAMQMTLSSCAAAWEQPETVAVDDSSSNGLELFGVDPKILRSRLAAELKGCSEPSSRHAEAACLFASSLLQGVDGETEAALSGFRQSLEVLAEVDDPYGAILVHVGQAEALRSASRWSEARAAYEEGSALIEALAAAPEPLRFELLDFMARVSGTGFVSPEMQRQMEPMLREIFFMLWPKMIDDRLSSLRDERASGAINEVKALVDRGNSSFLAGEYEAALLAGERALTLLAEPDLAPLDADLSKRITMSRVNALLLVAEVSGTLGFTERMSEKLDQACELAVLVDYPEACAIAELFEHLASGNPSEMTTDPIEVLVRSDNETVRESAPNIVPLLMAMRMGRLDHQGVDAVEAWLASEASQRAPLGQKIARLFIATRKLQEEHYGLAFEGFQELEGQFLQESAAREYETAVLLGLAIASSNMGRHEEAASWALELVESIEELVDDFRVETLLRAFLGGYRSSFYEAAVTILARAGKAVEAFEVTEQARARALLHSLGNQRLDPLSGADKATLKKIKGLQQAIRKLTGARAEGRGTKLLETRRALDELTDRLAVTRPELAAVLEVDPLGLDELRARVLPDETTLVVYYTIQDLFLAWVINAEGGTMMQLPLGTEEMADLVCLARSVSHRDGRGSQALGRCSSKIDLEQKYYRGLVAPVLKKAHHRRLIIVPHGVLHYVPFAALRDPDSGRYLLETHNVSYAPSASVLRYLSPKENSFNGEVLLLGDPTSHLAPLPGAREETEQIAQLFDTAPFVGSSATESRIRASAGNIDLLHLAAHGVYKPQAPRFSYIALAPGGGDDGRLEVHELFGGLDLNGVDLVVLSACQTALGEHTDGDEIIALTRAFLDAGSHAVISTLWRVDDKATASLMKTFYRELLGGANYGEALREAQAATMRREEWSDPYYWAAFKLTGGADSRWTEKSSSAF